MQKTVSSKYRRLFYSFSQGIYLRLIIILVVYIIAFFLVTNNKFPDENINGNFLETLVSTFKVFSINLPSPYSS